MRRMVENNKKLQHGETDLQNQSERDWVKWVRLIKRNNGEVNEEIINVYLQSVL